MTPYFLDFSQVLAKLTSKNQLTLPKSVTAPLGPVQYFEVHAQAGQIILTPVRIQRGDALRAKLAELAIDEKTLEGALGWDPAAKTAKKTPTKPLSGAKAASTDKKAAARKPAAKKTVPKKASVKPLSPRKAAQR